MNEIYHIRVQQADSPQAALAFQSKIEHLVENLFKEQYESGQEFLDSLEETKQPILDAYASLYKSDRKRMTYSIQDDQLIIGLVAGHGNEGKMSIEFTDNDIKAMYVMGLFLGNYLHIKRVIDPANKPVNIQRTNDPKIDQICMDNAKGIFDELDAIFAGRTTIDLDNDYVLIKPINVEVN